MLGGVKYLPADPKSLAEFVSDFSSRPRLTYRCDFAPIAPTSLTTDSGWGCMVRVGQSMLLETLARIRLGRATVVQTPGREVLELLKMFKDDPSAPYSIHSMAVMGQELDTAIGQWFGPTVLAHTIKRLCQSTPNAPLVFVAQDATIYPQDVRDMWDGTSLTTRPLLLLVPLLLGIENMTPIYWPFIQECIKCPYSVGIAGGRPSSALYMVGTFRDALLVLDPHYTQPALSATTDDWHTCFTSTVRCLASTSLDPSMCLGFMLKDRDEWDRWMAWMDEIKSNGIQVPICIAPATASGIMFPAGGVDGGGAVDAWDESSETDGDDG
ncbi:hypothetical protein BCR44DRAFT_133484 [Catenaria anguillulae PL171]|uniref:Cysteine protease n=1 Tax=Catenaria anguillulae PL171 TaxID=765915 RepID=A0A1Y2HYC1_9FUNG|nr:hypothetical protein BCR44DRAFT_133484 [Catenaria anguillulae PL171]